MYAFVDLVGSWSWAPICWLLVSHQLPPWIFCNRIYDHYFYLHITMTLNKWAIGVMRIVMKIMLTNLFCIAQHPKERFCNGWQWPLILLPPRLSTYLCEKYLLAMYEYIMVIPTHLHCVLEKQEKLKNQQIGTLSHGTGDLIGVDLMGIHQQKVEGQPQNNPSMWYRPIG